MNRRYAGPVIDPHHHLWDVSLGRHPWLDWAVGVVAATGGDPAPFRRSYGVADYLADAADQNVVATVHIEAGWGEAGGTAGDGLAETRWLDGLEKASGVAMRYVARVALDAPDAAEQLERQAANGRVVGIRDIVAWHPDPAKRFVGRPDLMDDPAWRAGLQRLARLGLSFDLLLYPGQMADAVRLVRDHPDIQFVLDHCGSPIDRDADSMARWRAGLGALGREPNVAVKISDLVAYDHQPTLESLATVVDVCVDGFGAGRAMFASDFPVAGARAGFAEVYDAFRAIVAGASDAEQRALFHDTARGVYRLPV